jgi:endonuclease YncB( thermonuclease family)
MMVLAVSGCGRAPAPPETAASEPSLAYRVKVVDAKTLVVDGRTVRLVNADTPELIPASRCWGEAVAAKEATLFVQQTILQGDDIEVTPQGGVDRTGSPQARVLVDGADLGEVLYEKGYAARPGERRFDWCGPVSRGMVGAPPLDPLFALGPR